MTKKYKLIILSNATPGQDDAFNHWYETTHVGDVLKIKGYNGVQRYKMAQPMSEPPLFSYCAIYLVETNSAAQAVGELQRRAGTDDMPLSETFDPRFYAALYEEISRTTLSSIRS